MAITGQFLFMKPMCFQLANRNTDNCHQNNTLGIVFCQHQKLLEEACIQVVSTYDTNQTTLKNYGSTTHYYIRPNKVIIH